MTEEDDLTMRVLVCGDRNWADRNIVGTILGGFLDQALSGFQRLTVIEGCAKGADWCAHHWYDGPCEEGHGSHIYVDHLHFPADWEQYGRSAGPIRNRKMLKEGKPQVVVAFHNDLENSKGTKDMVKVAKEAGLPVYLVSRQ